MKKIRFITIHLFVSAFLLCGAAAIQTVAAEERTRSANGKIAFTSDRDGNREIYLMNADGTGQTRLTNNSVRDDYPTWSPDGRRIAFLRQSEGTSSIKMMNADGTNLTEVTRITLTNNPPPYERFSIGWSPDGSKIAFQDSTDIFSVNIDGSNRVNLTNGQFENYEPSWSPDGSRIAFARYGASDNYGEVYTMNADGSDVRRITNSPIYTITGSPDWSPDGGRITLTAGSDALDRSHLALVNPDGTNLQFILYYYDFGFDINDPKWSPDARKIVFHGSGIANNASQIWVINRDGGGLTRLTDNSSNNFHPDWQPVSTTAKTPFDFDGDGKADISVFRPSNGVWYLQQSTNGFTGFQFGISTDKIVPADYDGDGRTDVAVYREGTWYLQQSRDGFVGIAFGLPSDVPMPADYNGDGKSEMAVFRPSNGFWYIYNLFNNQFTSIQFGQTGDVPVAADYDGDGKADIAVHRNRTWYLLRSRDGFTEGIFGQAEDKSVPADYDGDGKADIAIFRNGFWLLSRSQLGGTVIGFGNETDLPVPADYDGDGKADIAVYRPSNGTWYIQRSHTGFTAFAFGEANDKPVPNAFVGQGVYPIDISDFSFTPSTIDVTNSSQAVTVTLRVTDTERDVGRITVDCRSLTGNQYVSVNLNGTNRISGNARDGIYSTTAIFPQYSKAGTWKVEYIYVEDYGNQSWLDNRRTFYTSELAARGFAISLQVISNNEDVIPPEISDFSFTPTAINTNNGSRNITITLRAKDNKSGVSSIDVNFSGPAGCNYYEDECITFSVYITSADRISGDDKDGIYRVVLTIPQDSPFGIYLASVSARDAVGNYTGLSAAQLAARGYPSQLEITSAAPAISKAAFDLDGDGKTDAALFRPSKQRLVFAKKSSEFTTTGGGFSEAIDTPAPDAFVP
jgi:Tol biopolymer transport system component